MKENCEISSRADKRTSYALLLTKPMNIFFFKLISFLFFYENIYVCDSQLYIYYVCVYISLIYI